MIVYDYVADSILQSISFSSDSDSVTFIFTSDFRRKSWRFFAGGVKEFYGWDIRKSNVIDRIEIYSKAECATPHVIELLNGAIFDDSDINLTGKNVLFAELQTGLVEGKLVLASVEAAYGSEFLLVCEKVEFTEI
jgi:hypothetical protein